MSRLDTVAFFCGPYMLLGLVTYVTTDHRGVAWREVLPAHAAAIAFAAAMALLATRTRTRTFLALGARGWVAFPALLWALGLAFGVAYQEYPYD